MVATATPSTQKVQPEMRARSESLHEQHDAARDNDALSLATTPPAAVGDML